MWKIKSFALLLMRYKIEEKQLFTEWYHRLPQKMVKTFLAQSQQIVFQQFVHEFGIFCCKVIRSRDSRYRIVLHLLVSMTGVDEYLAAVDLHQRTGTVIFQENFHGSPGRAIHIPVQRFRQDGSA